MQTFTNVGKTFAGKRLRANVLPTFAIVCMQTLIQR